MTPAWQWTIFMLIFHFTAICTVFDLQLSSVYSPYTHNIELHQLPRKWHLQSAKAGHSKYRNQCKPKESQGTNLAMHNENEQIAKGSTMTDWKRTCSRPVNQPSWNTMEGSLNMSGLANWKRRRSWLQEESTYLKRINSALGTLLTALQLRNWSISCHSHGEGRRRYHRRSSTGRERRCGRHKTNDRVREEVLSTL